jgi:hypothetical protein
MDLRPRDHGEGVDSARTPTDPGDGRLLPRAHWAVPLRVDGVLCAEDPLDCPDNWDQHLHDQHLPDPAVHFHICADVVSAVLRIIVRRQRLREERAGNGCDSVCTTAVPQSGSRQGCQLARRINSYGNHRHLAVILLRRRVESEEQVCGEVSSDNGNTLCCKGSSSLAWSWGAQGYLSRKGRPGCYSSAALGCAVFGLLRVIHNTPCAFSDQYN